MKRWNYQAFIEERYHPELGRYLTYGIRVDSKPTTELIHDVTTDRSKAEEMARLFTLYRLSPLHFSEAVEDFLVK